MAQPAAEPASPLTREQWIAEHGNDDLFVVYDLNEDGVLSPTEQQAGAQAQEAINAVSGTLTATLYVWL